MQTERFEIIENRGIKMVDVFCSTTQKDGEYSETLTAMPRYQLVDAPLGKRNPNIDNLHILL